MIFLILLFIFPSLVFADSNSTEIRTKVVSKWSQESQDELRLYIEDIVKPFYTVEEVQVVGSRMFGGFRINSDLDVFVWVTEEVTEPSESNRAWVHMASVWKTLNVDLKIAQNKDDSYLYPSYCHPNISTPDIESIQQMLKEAETEEEKTALKASLERIKILQKQIETTDFCRYLPAYSLTKGIIREHKGKDTKAEVLRHQEYRRTFDR